MNADLVWNYLVLANVGSFVLMGFDKLSAKVDFERVPEIVFFLVALAGGFVGIVLGMFIFHHKTSKASFQIKIAAAAVLGTIVLFLLVKGT